MIPMLLEQINPNDLVGGLKTEEDFKRRVLALSDRGRLDPDYSRDQFEKDLKVAMDTPINLVHAE